MLTREDITQRIQQTLPDARVAVRDLTGGGDHFQVEVVSASFSGLPTLRRHRLVYSGLQDVLGGAMHALALTTMTPEELAASTVTRAPLATLP